MPPASTRSAKKEIQIMTDIIHKATKGPGDILDLTPELNESLLKSGFDEGSVTVFNIGSTAGITTIEYEPGLMKDMKEVYQRLVPQGPHYFHHETWGDANGFSHVRAAIQGPSLVVPFQGRKLLLGTWQQVVLMEFDDRPRTRKVVFQFSGF